MNLKISEHIFAKPLKVYLYLANYNISNVFNQINLKDDSLLDVLLPLRKLKAYDILLPFNILIKMSFDEEHLEWWNNVIARLDVNHEICELTEKLYQKFMNDGRMEPWKDSLNFQNAFNTFSIATMESFVWETCFEYFEDIYQDDTKFGIGLFAPGLYMSRKKYEFWKTIDEKVFPQLLNECQKISESFMVNRFELALIKRTVFTFCSELGYFYYNVIGNMVVPMISVPKTELEENCAKNLIQILETSTNRKNDTDFYISEKLVDQLCELYKNSEKYQFNSFSCKCLGFCLPVLLQCIGKYTSASNRAMSYISQLSVSDRTIDVLFLSLYIAMFTTSVDTQTRIGSIFEELYNGAYQLEQVIDVFNDIRLFFIKFSNELSMRFDENGIEQLKEKNDIGFYAIYECAVRDVLHGRKPGFEEVDDAYWLLTNLFGNGKLVSVIDKLLANISNEELSYSIRLMYVSHLRQLFCALTSHLDTEVRVCIREVCDFVDIPDSDDLKKVLEKEELFFIYNPIQVKELRELNGRLKNVSENLPRYFSTLRYEKNIVDFVREKLMDSQKQIVGSDFKRILLCNDRKDDEIWEKK